MNTNTITAILLMAPGIVGLIIGIRMWIKAVGLRGVLETLAVIGATYILMMMFAGGLKMLLK